MKTTIKKPLGVMALLLAVLAFNPASAQSYNMNVAGASPGGLWSLLGAGLDSAVREEFPGSTITYQTSGGGIANVAILQRDDADMGIIHDAELLLAKNGSEPFREPAEDIRVLAYLYTWAPMQAFMRETVAERHGIETLEDIARVQPPITIAVNRRGNVASNVAIEMLNAIGVTEEDIESWGGRIIYAASDEQMSLIQDRRADMILNSLFVRHSSIMQAGNSVDLRMLPMTDEDAIARVNERSGTISFTIPEDTYEWSPNSATTVSLGAALAVHERMDEETAYNLTKAIFENYDKLREVHPAMADLTTEVMASIDVVPFHPGAMRYLEEAGLR